MPQARIGRGQNMTQLYSNLKFLRFRPQLDALAQGGLAAPVHIRIKPINRCNHNCWYCAYRVDNLALGEAMNTEDVLPLDMMHGIVDDVIGMGVRAVTFSGGGEPLLYKGLPEVVRRLALGGVKVATLTNGSNLKGAMADAFAAHGAWVRVSLDAWDDESYARARGVAADSFTRLLSNLRAFAARKSDCVLGVSFIVSETNAPHLAKVCALLKDAGVNHVKVSGAVVSNDREENNAYHRRLHGVVAEQVAAAKRLDDDGFRIVDHYHELEDRFEKSYTRCAFLQFLTVIGADGAVYTCQDKAYTASGYLGSLRGRTFKEFWYSDENRKRLAEINPELQCRHHCVAHQKNLVLHEYTNVDNRHVEFV